MPDLGQNIASMSTGYASVRNCGLKYVFLYVELEHLERGVREKSNLASDLDERYATFLQHVPHLGGGRPKKSRVLFVRHILLHLFLLHQRDDAFLKK